MKYRLLLTHLLILVIGCQAVFASADVHQWHEGESDHQAVLEHQHHDAELLEEQGAAEGEESLESHDHHCCHCMSCHLSFLGPSQTYTDFHTQPPHKASVSQNHSAPWLAISLRPPIA